MKAEKDIRRMLDAMSDREPLTHEDYEDRGYRNALAWVLSSQDVNGGDPYE